MKNNNKTKKGGFIWKADIFIFNFFFWYNVTGVKKYSPGLVK